MITKLKKQGNEVESEREPSLLTQLLLVSCTTRNSASEILQSLLLPPEEHLARNQGLCLHFLSFGGDALSLEGQCLVI
jgi:hypothetical protein